MNVYNGISANGKIAQISQNINSKIKGAKGFDTNCGYYGVDGTATSVGLSQSLCLIKWKLKITSFNLI